MIRAMYGLNAILDRHGEAILVALVLALAAAAWMLSSGLARAKRTRPPRRQGGVGPARIAPVHTVDEAAALRTEFEAELTRYLGGDDESVAAHMVAFDYALRMARESREWAYDDLRGETFHHIRTYSTTLSDVMGDLAPRQG